MARKFRACIDNSISPSGLLISKALSFDKWRCKGLSWPDSFRDGRRIAEGDVLRIIGEIKNKRGHYHAPCFAFSSLMVKLSCLSLQGRHAP